ncbi:MAG: UDP-galactopyranose mutase [Clostridiales bacterium]|nr:UDP-galactopyranose mutase [Clostridiales bacterium]
MKKHALVIGLGFAGTVVAQSLADAGFTVTAFDKRSNVAGNMFEYERSNGVRVHMYGPHIFHTNLKHIYEYLSKFSAFYPYSHRVLGKIDGTLVPIPFNFTSIDKLFSPEKAKSLKSKLISSFPVNSRVAVADLLRHSDPEIAGLGQFVFDKVFKNYSAKQWGISVESLDPAVLRRVPVVIGDDDRYFSDSIQMMPLFGYTELFENMLRHPAINIHLNADALQRVRPHVLSGNILLDGVPFKGPVCYTGSIDELFDYALGNLPYRSLDLHFEDHPVGFFQTASVVNYPNEEKFTRITEFKHLTLQEVEGATTIMKEYPIPYRPGGRSVPFYPIQSDDNHKLYRDYLELCDKYEDLYLCGRLAEYKYYNMDAVIDRALSVAEQIKTSERYK